MPQPLITVFGGSGFLGRQLVKRLAARGYRIRVAVRRPHLAHFLQPLGTVGQIVPVQANVRDDASSARALAGADAIVNLVGLRRRAGPQTFDAVHVEAAGRIARLAAEAGVARLVHVSMLGADAEAPSDLARSKARGEDAVRAQRPDAAIVRPAIMFGPGDQVFNGIASCARFTPVMPLAADDTRMQPLYVADAAEAILRVVAAGGAAGGAGGETYELAGPRVHTWRELVEIVLHEIGRRRLLLPVPVGVMALAGAVAQNLPFRPLTADGVRWLASDCVATSDLPGLAALGVAPTTLEVVLPTYLRRFVASPLKTHTAPL